ncbi:hypothetical protein ACFX10_014298 [Malus domestica]
MPLDAAQAHLHLLLHRAFSTWVQSSLATLSFSTPAANPSSSMADSSSSSSTAAAIIADSMSHASWPIISSIKQEKENRNDDHASLIHDYRSKIETKLSNIWDRPERESLLQGNLFSGEIPEFVYSLHDLVRLNLASNNFFGEISLGFNNLTRLRTLYLESNKLSGAIPKLKLPNLKQFNVSNNLLNGYVPKQLQSYSSSSFLGNSLCGRPLNACPEDRGGAANPAIGGDININDHHKKRKLSGGAIAGIVIGSVLAFLVIVMFLIFFCRKKKSKKTSSVDIATVKHREVEIPGEKLPVESENGGYGNGHSVADAVAAAMVGNGKSEAGGASGAKKLAFFGNTVRVFDI